MLLQVVQRQRGLQDESRHLADEASRVEEEEQDLRHKLQLLEPKLNHVAGEQCRASRRHWHGQDKKGNIASTAQHSTLLHDTTRYLEPFLLSAFFLLHRGVTEWGESES